MTLPRTYRASRFEDALALAKRDLGPDAMERALVEVLGEGDRAAYYYLSDAKRMFRVLIR